MVDKIDPTNQTSVEYGQSLLERKYRQEEKFAKEARKDRKINYAMQVLGGVDNLIKDRARRNMEERNNELTQQIIREEAEFAKLQKEYNDQEPWRTYSKNPYDYAVKLATESLDDIWGGRVAPGASSLSDEEEKEYFKARKDLADFHYNRYQENKISALPFETKEAYTAELRAMLNKQAPSGLLDIALRGVGFRGNKQEELATKIGEVQDTYKDSLRARTGVKGAEENLSEDARLALIQVPKKDLSPQSTPITIPIRGVDTRVIEVKTWNNDTKEFDYKWKDMFGEYYTSSELGIEASDQWVKNKVQDVTKRYIAKHDMSQTATIHSAINNPKMPEFYDPELYQQLLKKGMIVSHFNNVAQEKIVKSNFESFLTDIKETEEFKDEDFFEKQLELKSPKAKVYALSQGSPDINKASDDIYNNFKLHVIQDAMEIQRTGVRVKDGTLQEVSDDLALRLSLFHNSKGITELTTGAGWGDGRKKTVYTYKRENLPELTFDAAVPPIVNRDKDGTPDNKQQKNRDIKDLVESEEFQSKTPTEQKAILQNAKDKGADINPDLLRPEGEQLELTGDEMLLADEGPTVQEAQEYLDREKEIPSRPSRQQTPIDLSTLTEEELEEYSRRGGEKALSKSNVFARQQIKQRLKTLERYADGVLTANRKPSLNSSVGKALRAFNLENMSRSEIKEWLKENTLETLAPKQ